MKEETVLSMCETLMRKNGGLQFLDLSQLGALNFRFHLSQESWEALFRLMDRDPRLQVRASSHTSRWRFSTFLLRDKEAADQFFQQEEVKRGIRLNQAGLSKLLSAAGNATFAQWVNVMEKVSDDSIALFHILRENPMICDKDFKQNNTGRKRKTPPDDNPYKKSRKLPRRVLLPRVLWIDS
jgi:hypothetical protein